MVYFSYDDYVHPMERGQWSAQFPQKTLRGAPIPYYMAFPMNDGWDTEEENQRDYERLKQMYPKRMQRIMEVIEEECDKLEYDGSMMFDEYPDPLSLMTLCDNIQQQIQDVDMEEVYEAMQRRPGTPPPPPNGNQDNWVSDIVKVLLFDEMHRRRSRRRSNCCRRMKF